MEKVIAGFPGVGKSTLYRKHKDLVISDSDSSKFDKTNFPQNYIDHIKKLLSDGTTDIILVSTHEAVISALDKEGIDFTVVIPNINRKEEFLENYRERGNDEKFIKLIGDNWDKWLGELRKRDNVIVLDEGKFLKDIAIPPKIGFSKYFAIMHKF